MGFKRTLRRIQADRDAADEDRGLFEEAPSNSMLGNLLLGGEMSKAQLMAAEAAYDALEAAAQIDGAVEAASQIEEKGILALAVDAFTAYGGTVVGALEAGETAGLGAMAAGALGTARTDDEKTLMAQLDSKASEVGTSMEMLFLVAQQHYRLPAGISRVDGNASVRSNEVERADGELEAVVQSAVDAANGFNRASSPLDAYKAVSPHMGEGSGHNAYIIGACVEATNHDLATTGEYIHDICVSFGVSIARFANLFEDGAPSIEDADDGGAGDSVPAANMIAPILKAIEKDDYAGERSPEILPQCSENIQAVLDWYRLHTLMGEVHSVSKRTEKGHAVDPRELTYASEVLVQVQSLLPRAIAGATGVRRRAGLLMGTSEKLRVSLTTFRAIEYESFGTDKLDDMELRLEVLHGTETLSAGPTDEAGMLTPDQLAALATAVSDAGDDVEKSVKGIGLKVVKNKVLSNVNSFSKLPLKKMSLEKIYAAAQKRELTGSEAWETVKTTHGIVDTAMGGLKDFVDTADSGLDALVRTETFDAHGDWDSYDSIRAKSGNLKRISQALDKAGKVGDAISLLDNVGTLLSEDATGEERADAAVDLIGMGISKASGTAGGLFALGVAYVQLIRSEFKRIAAIEKAGYAGLANDAFADVALAMGHAQRLGSRLASAQNLLANGGAPDVGKLEKLVETLAHNSLYAAKAVHTVCVDVTNPDGHVSEALVGWTGTQVPLQKQYLLEAGRGPHALDAATSGSTTEEKINALHAGGGRVFTAAGNLAQSIGFAYRSRMDSYE